MARSEDAIYEKIIDAIEAERPREAQAALKRALAACEAAEQIYNQTLWNS